MERYHFYLNFRETNIPKNLLLYSTPLFSFYLQKLQNWVPFLVKKNIELLRCDNFYLIFKEKQIFQKIFYSIFIPFSPSIYRQVLSVVSNIVLIFRQSFQGHLCEGGARWGCETELFIASLLYYVCTLSIYLSNIYNIYK